VGVADDGRARRDLERAPRADRAAGELFSHLAEANVDALLLRGPAIAQRLYDRGERGYSDVDVLVPAEGLSGLEASLRVLGYAPYTLLGRAQHWRREHDRAEIDLHLTLWGVSSPPSALWGTLSAERSTLEVHGCEVPVPGLAGTALVVALHASQHGTLVVRPLADLERALDRFAPAIWSAAAAHADTSGSLRAFRQGLSLQPAGRERLAALGLVPALTTQAALRSSGIRVPAYLFEHLSLRERLSILRLHLRPGRAAIAAFVDPRATSSRSRLLAAHARRLARLPKRTYRLGTSWWAMRRELASLVGEPDPAPGDEDF
jgi:hypothetical protein